MEELKSLFLKIVDILFYGYYSVDNFLMVD